MDKFAGLSAFVKAAEHGSFAKAGEAIGVHGSAVSKSVARLEERLGVRLFHRTTRSLTLTDEGRAFLERCTRILSDLDEAETAMTCHGSVPRGRLVVSLPVALGRLHLVPFLARLPEAHPGLDLVVHLVDRQVDIVGEGFDAAIRIGELRDSSLVGRRLATARSVVCASDRYLAAMGTPRTPDELSRHQCVTFVRTPHARPSPWRFAGRTARSRIDVEVAGPLRVNNAEALVEAAVAGAGIAQLHTYLAAPEIAAGRLRPLLEEHATECGPPIHVLHPSARQVSPRVRTFIDLMAELLAPVPIWERAAVDGVAARNPDRRRADPRRDADARP